MAIGVMILVGLIGGLDDRAARTGGERVRLVVLTDVSSLTAGVAEPDDGQSLIRLMLYANEMDIEGLIATSNMVHGRRTRPELIRRVVDAYEKARPNLLEHDPRYPPAESLRVGVKAGQAVAGLDVEVETSIGEGKDTAGSDWIIRVADRPDPRPVWVVVWGGSADLAQALWRVRRDRTAQELEQFLKRIRVNAVNDQDSTGLWIREQFPTLFNITQRRSYRGMYRGGDIRLVSSAWVKENIRGHGPLGDLYPDYRGGDIWSARLGPVRGIKEGDTPSYLALIPNGLFDPERPWLGGWGGRFEGAGRRLTDIPDADIDASADPDPRMSSVYRWREAFQNDFAARLDWCVKPRREANHPPIARIGGFSTRAAKPGDAIDLDASGSSDPDGDALRFRWSLYPPDAELANSVKILDDATPKPRVELGEKALGKTVPLLLSVTDEGAPSLTRYGRILIKVGASGSPIEKP